MMCASLICVSFGGKETREQAFAVLLAAESFYLPGPVGLFLFSLFLSFFFFVAESPVIFQRLLSTTIFPVVLLTQHILQE